MFIGGDWCINTQNGTYYPIIEPPQNKLRPSSCVFHIQVSSKHIPGHFKICSYIVHWFCFTPKLANPCLLLQVTLNRPLHWYNLCWLVIMSLFYSFVCQHLTPVKPITSQTPNCSGLAVRAIPHLKTLEVAVYCPMQISKYILVNNKSIICRKFVIQMTPKT